MRFSILAAAFLTVFAGQVSAQDYQTSEFSDPDGAIPRLFVCMFAGSISEVEPLAIDIGLSIAIDETGADDLLLDQWTSDVVTLISNDLRGTDWVAYWQDNCTTVFTEAKAYYGL